MNHLPSEETMFRKFEPEDMAAATKLAWDAWARGDEDGEGPEDVDPRVMEGYVRSFLMRSNWNEVVYDSHGVIGIMFGRIDKSEKQRKGVRPLLRELGLIPGFLFNRYGPGSAPPAVILQFLLTEFKVFLLMPRSDAEINLLIVDAGHRGRGIGRMLVERFIDAARRVGSELVTLYTDDQVSNWRFYEVLGFHRVATYHDGLTSYFIERDAKGIVYAMNLKKGAELH